MRFEEYVAARGQSLLRLAYVLTRDVHAAEDLVHTALTDAYRHWRKVSRAEHPDAYVRRIVVNTHVSSRRRRWTGERPTEEAVDGVVGDHADDVVSRDASRRVLDRLPPKARAVLVLRYYADLDDAAIAELLGLAPSTVRATASRALTTLRQQHAVPPRAAAEETT